MASRAFSVTLGASLGEGRYNTTAKGQPAPVANTAVAADIATLVADGATPTQAHVTTLNTDWGVYNAANNGTLTADLTIVINTANITSRNALSAALKAALRQVDNSGILTP